MEKSTKSSSSSSKGTNSDTKTKQDGTNKYPRIFKHKENVCSRPESARRSHQRNRIAYDKRPRSRGAYCTDRDRSEVAQTEKLAVVSAVKQGSKKLSLNHLLNFTLAPSCGSSDYRTGGWQTGRNHRKQKLPKYNKEQFLQANCQFVVRQGGDYTIHETDPDILVDWNLVEEIHLPSHQVPSCPICLYPPISAKITRCGHIYCWSCLLHYLSLSDKSWRKCPICYEAIHKGDLKSVVSTSKVTYSVGDEIEMCLMKRKRGSVISKPMYQSVFSSNGPISLDDDANCFHKLLIASKNDVKKIIQRERKELLNQLAIEGNVPEGCFLELALELLQEREKSLIDIESMEENIGMFEFLSINDKPEIYENIHNNNLQDESIYDNSCHQIEYMVDPFSDEDHEAPYNNKTSFIISDDDHLNVENMVIDNSALNESSSSPEIITPFVPKTTPNQKQTKCQGKDYCYFYQAIDGQHIYLHAINVQMLVKEYGDLEHSPHKFKAKIVDLEGVSMTEPLRERFRYLHHLPLTCEFQVAELNLKPPVISRDIFKAFEEEIEKRNRMRRRKAREEKRRERHIEQEEYKKLGKFPGLKYQLDSLQHFPACNKVIDVALNDPPLPTNSLYSESTIFEESTKNVFQNCESPNENNDGFQPASFAQMLREGKTKQQSFSFNPPDPNKMDNLKSTTGLSTSDEENTYEAVPVFRQSLGDAIQAALDNINHISSENTENSVKKKKNKKTVLFSTSMNRRQ